MNNAILLAIAGLLLILPFANWLNERRLRLAAGERLKIARAVTEFERLLLKGEIQHGQVCHDHVFPAMYRAQFCSHYPLPTPPRTPEAQLLTDQLREELDDGKSPATKPLIAFRNAYFGALIYTHPIKIGLLLLGGLPLYFAIKILRGQIRAALGAKNYFARFRARITADSASKLTLRDDHHFACA